jgi:hypothetical protein
MKKLATTAAVLCGFASFGMEQIVFDRFDIYVREWSAHLKSSLGEGERPQELPFSTALFKEKLLAEIGEDPVACEIFELFHRHNFSGLWEYWQINKEAMLPNNFEKFRDLLMLSAPVIDLAKGTESCVKGIILMSDKSNITEKIKEVLSYDSRFPQFSYEMLFCVMVDSDEDSSDDEVPIMLSQACEEICGSIANRLNRPDWTLKEKEFSLLEIVGRREDELGYYGEDGVIRLWDARWLTDDGDVLAVRQRFFGDDDH